MNPETFAAKRRERLLVADDDLAPYVEAALTRYMNGEDSWYSGLVAAAAQLWIEHFQAEAPGARYTAAIGRFRESLAESLEQTSQPLSIVSTGQVNRITRWLSTYTVNAATVQGSYSAGVRYKMWATMEDSDVRDIHRPLEGKVVPIGSTFNVNGTKLPYPAAPVGPPEVWIECRCVSMPASRQGETMTANTFALGPDDDVDDGSGPILGYDVVTADASLTNPDGTPYTGALVVLVPADDDPVVAASSEPAHVTTIWFGEAADVPVDFDDLEQAVRLYAQDLDGPVVVPVASRGTLGDDDADVVHLEKTDSLLALRDGLLVNPPIKDAFDAAEQFPEWNPHITLGYPDRPALAEYDADSVTFDRIALWWGGEHYDYSMGGTVDTVTAAGPIDPEDVAVEVADEEDLPNDDVEDEPLDALIPIHGVLAPEDILSGDGRGFRAGAVSSRKLPLHYRYEYVGSHGGNQTSQAVTVGTINDVWRHSDGMNRFIGYIDPSRPYADQALADILMGIGFNSIDADAMEQDVSMYFDADGNMLEQEAPNAENAGKGPETWYSKVRVAGLTQVPIQAFPETYTALGHDFEEDMTEEQLVAAAAILEECGCNDVIDLTDDPVENARAAADAERLATGGIVAGGKYPLAGGEGSPEYILPLEGKFTARPDLSGIFAPGTKDGPGWVTNPGATKRIRDYWTRGEGAAKIGWGTPGDFNRCRAQLAKYVQNPEWLAGLCANMHYEVLKTWPGPKRGDKGHALAASGAEVAERDVMTLVASAGAVYSSSAFSEPQERRAFPMRIDREARTIEGYAAQWGVCHIGITGMCQEPPKSSTNYRYFRKGIVETDHGEQEVALLTYGIGHAGDRVSAAAATAHYDQTDAVRAYINVGENAFGIWYSGVLAPWVTDADIDAMLAIRRVSGDWRNWSGRRGDLEMVGLVVVNTEGFQLAASAALDGMVSGVQTAAIGIGAVPIDDEQDSLTASGSESEANQAFLAGAVVKAVKMIEDKKRADGLRQRAYSTRQADLRTRAGRKG